MGGGPTYYLNDANSGTANRVLTYGDSGDEVFVADTDGRGGDSLTIRRHATFFVRNSLSSGVAESTFVYGNPGDVVLFGDWNGDGVDTPAVRRGNRYFLRNSLQTGNADVVLTYGDPSDAVLVGDWNGDGRDSLAVRRGNQYFISNSLATGVAEQVLVYGDSGDVVLVGSWNGRSSSLGVRRGSTYYLKNGLGSWVADSVFGFGEAADIALVGDWNGDGTESIGIRRMPVAAAPTPAYASQLVDGINAHRAAAGLRTLTPSGCAAAAAQRWADYLVATGSFEHQDLGGVLRACPDARMVAENLASTSGSPAEMVEMWMNSAGHRGNVLNGSLSSVGSVAIQRGNGQWVGVHVFTG